MFFVLSCQYTTIVILFILFYFFFSFFLFRTFLISKKKKKIGSDELMKALEFVQHFENQLLVAYFKSDQLICTFDNNTSNSIYRTIENYIPIYLCHIVVLLCFSTNFYSNTARIKLVKIRLNDWALMYQN